MWDTPLTLWLTAYLDLGVFSFIQLNNASNSLQSPTSFFNLSAAVLFGLGVLATPFLIWSFLSRNYGLLATKQDQQFVGRWGALTKDFRSSDAVCLVYYCAFTARRAVFFLALTITQDYPGVITAVSTGMSIAVSDMQNLGYLAVYTPFAVKVDQVSAIVNESAVLLVYLSVFSFVFPLDSLTSGVIGAVGTWVARGTIFMNVALSGYRTCLMVVQVIKMYSQMVRVQSLLVSTREVGNAAMRINRTRV